MCESRMQQRPPTNTITPLTEIKGKTIKERTAKIRLYCGLSPPANAPAPRSILRLHFAGLTSQHPLRSRLDRPMACYVTGFVCGRLFSLVPLLAAAWSPATGTGVLCTRDWIPYRANKPPECLFTARSARSFISRRTRPRERKFL